MVCIFYSLNDNIDLFLTPSELVEKKDVINKNIRLGGVVKKGSIQKGSGLYLSFITTDFKKEIQVKYNGILPDLFREGQGIVAYGKYLDNGIFYAKEILTKHDEKYMPPILKK
jgi:cytochrome c-type biogenesis protein CcmE